MRAGNRSSIDSPEGTLTVELPPHLVFATADPPPEATSPALQWQVAAKAAQSAPLAQVLTSTVSAALPSEDLTVRAVLDTVPPEPPVGNNQAVHAMVVGDRLWVPVVLKE